MTLILSGTDGLSDIDGSAATPAIRGTDANTGIFFGTDIIGFSEGGVESARFNADAQFVAAAGTAALPVITTTGDVNTGIFFPAADTIAFAEGGAEAMRITSSGEFLVGATSTFSSCFVGVSFDGNAKNGLVLRTSTNASGAGFAQFVDNSNGQCGIIARVGTTSAVVYTASSDRRLKENIVDAPSAIAHINAVKVRSYNWIDGGHQVKYGVIAQEFVEVEPDAVVQGDNAETVEKTWSVDTAALVPAMIKAIQEQQALITALTTRITALEGVA